MERLRRTQRTGLTTDGLRNWAMVFLVLGIFGRSVLQNRMLGMSSATNLELLETMLNAPEGMAVLTVALLCQLLESCAAPIFCFLLVEGVSHTSNFMNYLGRVAGLALISELPYNFAMSGKFFDLGSRNPVFAMVLCLVMLYFYQRYSERTFTNTVIKLCVTLAALVWANMLSIEHGSCCVVIVAVLWAFRSRQVYRNIMGCTATIACTLFSMYYLAAPMSFLAMHFYNGEKGERDRRFNYLFYPIVLVAVGLVSVMLF